MVQTENQYLFIYQVLQQVALERKLALKSSNCHVISSTTNATTSISTANAKAKKNSFSANTTEQDESAIDFIDLSTSPTKSIIPTTTTEEKKEES